MKNLDATLGELRAAEPNRELTIGFQIGRGLPLGIDQKREIQRYCFHNRLQLRLDGKWGPCWSPALDVQIVGAARKLIPLVSHLGSIERGGLG